MTAMPFTRFGVAARLERPRNRRPIAKQNNLTNGTVGNEESRVKARGGRRLKRVIAGTCVDLLTEGGIPQKETKKKGELDGKFFGVKIVNGRTYKREKR